MAPLNLTQALARQQHRLRMVVVGALVLFGMALAGWLLLQREQVLAREAERLQSQVRVIDANLTQQLQGMAAALQSVLDDKRAMAQPSGANSLASARLRTLTDAMPGVRTLMVTDATGRVQASSRDALIDFDASVRPFFQLARSQSDPHALYLSEPYRSVLNVYSLLLVRSFQDSRGQFGGVVAATLEPAYFQVLLSSVLYADDMRATLIHGQGRVFLTLPDNPAIVGSQVARSGTLFSLHRDSGQTETLHIGQLGLAGHDRMYAFHTIQPAALRLDQPLVLTVNRGMEAVLHDWRQMALNSSLGYGLLCVVVMWGLLLLQRGQKALVALNDARAAEAQRHSERLELALAGAELGLWELDLQTGERRVNARAQLMLGLAADAPALSHADWVARIHPDDRPRVHTVRMRHLQGHPDLTRVEYRIQHADGHWIWVRACGKVVARGPQGEPLRSSGTYMDISELKDAQAQIPEPAARPFAA